MLSKIMVIAASALVACDAHRKQDVPKSVADVSEVAKPTTAIEPAPNAPAPVATPTPAVPPIEATARQLFADYQANEVSADAKYRGKALEVTGIVTKIAKDVLDKPYVELQTQNQFESVKASFDNESAVISLKRGQKIVARCRGEGSLAGSPMLDGCVIEHVFEWVPK